MSVPADPSPGLHRLPLRDAPATSPAPPNLTEDHYRELRRAMAARRPIRNAARTACASAITILVVGVAAIPVALVNPSWLGLLVVVGVCTVGVVEYVGSRRMGRGQPAAALLLGTNQLALLGLITLYCTFQMLRFSAAQTSGLLLTPEVEVQLAQVPEIQQDIQRQLDLWGPLVAYGFYSLVILLSLAFQGSLAIYYFTRRRHLLAAPATTPAWAQRLLAELGLQSL